MDWLNKEYSIELHNPLTEEERDAILDVDMEHTTSVEFTTKHGRKVEFAKVRHGRWIFGFDPETGERDLKAWTCSECNEKYPWQPNYCPNCGAKMDGGEDEHK